MGAGRLSRQDVCLIQMLLRHAAARQVAADSLRAELDAMQLLCQPGGTFTALVVPVFRQPGTSHLHLTREYLWNRILEDLEFKTRRDILTVISIATGLYSGLPS